MMASPVCEMCPNAAFHQKQAPRWPNPTHAISRLDSNTSRVPRSNSSSEYFRALAMPGDFSFRQANPGIEVSVKPRMAHL
jgi:hypothetical protein